MSRLFKFTAPPQAHNRLTTTDPRRVLRDLTGLEMALQATSKLAVVWALGLALLLVLAHHT